MGARISVDFEKVREGLGILRANLRKALLEGIADHIFAITRKSFEKESSPEGMPWPALSARYAALKAKLFPGKTVLQRRGGLLRSLFRQVEEDRAIVGATMPYSAIHQFGGIAGRKPPFKKDARAHKQGKFGPFGRRPRIPARPFLPSPEMAEREAARVAKEILDDAVEQAGLK